MRITKQHFKCILRGGLIFTLILSSCSSCNDTKKKLNHAAALGWREYVQTDLDMSEFYGNNFTLAARFMVQYPKAYVGPIMAASNGGLEISKQDDATTLVARFGNTTAAYPSVNLQVGKWHHLALVRNNNSLQLFFDGQQACPSGLANCTVAVGNVAPSGTLRLGRPGTNPLSGTVESQHYGFIDDVALFKLALSQNQIQSLIDAPRLLGNEANSSRVGLLTPARQTEETCRSNWRGRLFIKQSLPVARSSASSRIQRWFRKRAIARLMRSL